MALIPISPTGIRNEYWRKRLLVGLTTPPRYARLMVTRGVAHHPCGLEALGALLTGPAQMDDGVNPWGDCEMLMVSLAGEDFYLMVTCYAATDALNQASEDPADDEKTTRVFTCMLASEY